MQDNLNTHKPASLYEAFPAPEARRLVERFEWHYTPKHGSWLDMAESELSVLSGQCLDRRISDKPILTEEVADTTGSQFGVSLVSSAQLPSFPAAPVNLTFSAPGASGNPIATLSLQQIGRAHV